MGLTPGLQSLGTEEVHTLVDPHLEDLLEGDEGVVGLDRMLLRVAQVDVRRDQDLDDILRRDGVRGRPVASVGHTCCSITKQFKM